MQGCVAAYSCPGTVMSAMQHRRRALQPPRAESWGPPHLPVAADRRGHWVRPGRAPRRLAYLARCVGQRNEVPLGRPDQENYLLRQLLLSHHPEGRETGRKAQHGGGRRPGHAAFPEWSTDARGTSQSRCAANEANAANAATDRSRPRPAARPDSRPPRPTARPGTSGSHVSSREEAERGSGRDVGGTSRGVV